MRKPAFGTEEFLTSYWKDVDQSGGKWACWPWMGNRQKTGAESRSYGYYMRNGKHFKAHVTMWLLMGGPPPPKRFYIMHLCDHGWCVNPNHLVMGPHNANVFDGMRKDRHAKGRLPDEPVPPTQPYLVVDDGVVVKKGPDQ